MRFPEKYQEKIYAGVLGKMIGVYLGRPVEGWPYQDIINRFGELPYYVHDQLGLPLIVADDDISGTFAFFRAMEDSGFDPKLSAKEIGDAWLNYIIENKTILWWGGLGNSTEHTAYLHLKHGIPAPQSGSIAMNGPVLAQQIGAQIFMDAYAMMCPGDPEKAVYYVRQAASVSHDGVAVDAAGFLGAIEAAAFDEPDLNKLLDGCARFIESPLLQKAVADTRDICAKHTDWRKVREWLDPRYGYGCYPGPCHIIPNHTMVLASLIMGGDSFADSIKIASSAAWDTDCNAANVGCVNGIRLGLTAINDGPDFRTPVADRALVVTSDGGEGISDAVRETRRVVAAAAALRGEEAPIPAARYAFEYPGARQGFEMCPCETPAPAGTFTMQNANLSGGGDGLRLSFASLAEGVPVHVSVATFLDIREAYTAYETFVSPTLYSGQTVTAELELSGGAGPFASLYIWYADAFDKLQRLHSEPVQLTGGGNTLQWTVPDTGGMPVCRVGLCFESNARFAGDVTLRTMDWNGPPTRFAQNGVLMQGMWDLSPFWAKAFVSSAKVFTPNLNYTYVISHDEENGLATIGTREWTDYTVTSTVKLSLHKQGGLVARSRGHRRYYAAVLRGGDTLAIIKRRDGEETVLASIPFAYDEFTPYQLAFTVNGRTLRAQASGVAVECTDDSGTAYTAGAAGFLIDYGAMFINGFLVERQ